MKPFQQTTMNRFNTGKSGSFNNQGRSIQFGDFRRERFEGQRRRSGGFWTEQINCTLPRKRQQKLSEVTCHVFAGFSRCHGSTPTPSRAAEELVNANTSGCHAGSLFLFACCSCWLPRGNQQARRKPAAP